MAQVYYVKRGDSLQKIAKALLGDPKLYARIAEYNALRDPNRLTVGQRLEIPSRREIAPPPAPTNATARPPPHGLQALLGEFGDIYAYMKDDGTVDPRWETEHLARAAIPFPIPLSWDPSKQARSIYCHRRLVPVFSSVFAEIDRRGLRGEVRTFGGCYNVRSKRSGSKLSTHAWGIAIDLNPETNGMGQRGDLSAEVVEVFESYGFAWGGRWAGSGRDPMHFQYCTGY